MLDIIKQNSSIILLGVIILLLIIILLILTIGVIKPMKKRMNDLSLEMFILMRKQRSLDDSSDEIKHALNIINHNIGSLSSSTNEVSEVLQSLVTEKKNKPKLPTPEIAQKMRETILENINIEVLLAEQMQIPRKDATRKIIDATIAAYPDIDYEYTIKLCLALIENFVESVSGKGNNST